MRIDHIHLKNFKLFADFSLTLHPNFTLLIGENGAGKTSVLDALAIACGVWLYDVPDQKIASSRVSLADKHIRLEAVKKGDRTQFVPAQDTIVSAWGLLLDEHKEQWTQEIVSGKKRKVHLKEARAFVSEVFSRVTAGNDVTLPVIAYYGAGRAWLPHTERSPPAQRSYEKASRWKAYYDCLNERIRIADLRQWFWDETTERGNREGRYRPGFEVVKRAVLNCIPDADGAWFDTDRKDIVLSIKGLPQPFGNLSAGQRMMVALVADIAIKCVTQNNYLVPPDELGPDDIPVSRVLAETPGVVLIDELDVHLHPRWQRRVVDDLRKTFPKIQFVATTHSPQILGEVPAGQVIQLEAHQNKHLWQTFGMDSNWLLKHVMHGDVRNADIERALTKIEHHLQEFELEEAETGIANLRTLVGETPDTVRLDTGLRRALELTEPDEETEPVGRRRAIDYDLPISTDDQLAEDEDPEVDE